MTSFDVVNPYTEKVFKSFNFSTKSDVSSSMMLLKQGLKVHRSLSKHERASVLSRLGNLILENKNELAQLITCEMGKTITDSLVEIDRSANTAFCAADTIRVMTDEVLDSDAYPPKRDKIAIVKRKPIGIVLAITPFNFPINLSVHKIAPAFAAGNTVLFKPGPQNYFSAKRLVEICYDAGIPRECLQLSCPDIPVLSELISSDDVQCISFTGGTKTAEAISKNAGYKKLLFELGGNDPLIVMDDADLDLASTVAINQRFGTAGQRCTASKRVFIHEKVYSKFKTLLLAKSEGIVIGDPSDPKTFIGPLVNRDAADKVESRINSAITNGANLLKGGKRHGNIIEPTILENVLPSDELISDETFGPVIPLIKFSSIDEMIDVINSTPYGLQSGVFTNNLSLVKRLYEDLNVGALAVNDGPGFRAEHFPFGGVKKSGLGREGIKYAIEEMSTLKTLIM
jgi:acyl-CoA reductase-like NAD-dependent aldehyde dehydrogenase